MQRHLTPADDAWPTQLRQAGFQSDLPSVWPAEGLLVYLGAVPAERLLRQIAQSASPGSRLGTDFSDSFLRSQRMQSYLRGLGEQEWEARRSAGGPSSRAGDDAIDALGGQVGHHLPGVAELESSLWAGSRTGAGLGRSGRLTSSLASFIGSPLVVRDVELDEAGGAG